MNTIGYITTTLNWFGFFISFFLAYYFFLRFRNREIVLLIEKGIDVSEIYKKKKFPWFILGFTLLGVSIGVLVSILVFVYSLDMREDSEVSILILASVLLLGAIGVIVGNIVERKRG